MTQTYDLIVVGAGINGLCTAWQAHEADPHLRILVLEQFPFGHTRGSSHGCSRIIRKLYAEDYYCDMMELVYPMWQQLEELLNETILIKCQTVGMGTPQQVAEFSEALKKKKCSFRECDKAAIVEIYPHFQNFPDTKRFILDPEGGILLANKCISGLQRILESRGVTLRDGTKVHKINPQDGNNIEILTTNDEIFQCTSLIICANTWTSKLMEPLGVHVPTQPLKVCSTYWKIRENAQHNYDVKHYPTFYDVTEFIYSTPEYEYPSSVKVTYHAGVPCDPDRRDNQPFDEQQMAKLQQFVENYLPDLEASPAVTETCLYDETESRAYILDYHPNFKNIVFACGFSGQGFKTGPIVGRILANMALGRSPGFNIEPFSLDAAFKRIAMNRETIVREETNGEDVV